jgi:hypothetical protein
MGLLGHVQICSHVVFAGRTDEARRVAERLVGDDENNFEAQGLLGLIAAGAGNRETAERVLAWFEDLDRPYLYGLHTWWRSVIAGELGAHELAVALLREAFSQGRRGYGFGLAEYYEPLRGCPPFEEFIRPKG